MRLGLIGPTGHWQTYAPALEHVAGLTLVAVAPAGPEETMGAFDHAPGLTVDTRCPTGLPVRSRCSPSPTCSRNSPVPSAVKPHPPLTLSEACRITEIALKAQQAADSGQVVSLRESPYHDG